MREVVLYTKAGCCLCDDAKEALRAARAEVEFTLREVDIESDRELYEAHRNDVPVIEIDGRRAFKYRVTAQMLVERLSR
ncbi:MAG: glutaredoxin family protein [Myxococcales bacterium]